jgi:hypothetical protein
VSGFSVQFGAAFFGATLLELVHWYELRDKLSSGRYKRLIRSPAYWVLTVLMAFGSAVGVVIWTWDSGVNYRLFDFAVFGAAFPVFFKTAVRVAARGKGRHLGQHEDQRFSSVRTYFGLADE